jgi:hypothetical protein
MNAQFDYIKKPVPKLPLGSSSSQFKYEQSSHLSSTRPRTALENPLETQNNSLSMFNGELTAQEMQKEMAKCSWNDLVVSPLVHTDGSPRHDAQ